MCACACAKKSAVHMVYTNNIMDNLIALCPLLGVAATVTIVCARQSLADVGEHVALQQEGVVL